MRKVIIPFNGGKYSEIAVSFANTLNKIQPILITGIFFTEFEFSKFFLLTESLPEAGYESIIQSEKEVIKKNIERFINSCKKNDIQYALHEIEDDFTIPELTKETRFADLMIIASKDFYKNSETTDYLKDMLHHTECPVLIVPKEFYFPSQNILAYDGSASSVFAIKQFAYLFPDLCNNKTILVYAGAEGKDIPGQVHIEEFTSSHFSNLAISVLHNNRKKNFHDWILEHQNPLLVSGSFGRSGFSSLFTKDFVLNIIDEHKTLIFIAHQ